MSTSQDQSKDRAPYPLNRDALASARLHLQHQIWISSLGYHLHPSIPLPQAKKPTSTNTNTINITTPPFLIAEIGSGTGLFTLQLAAQNPHTQIHAYDLSLSQTPPQPWWPDNVTFSGLDIFDPIPEELIGKYDIVCIRHFICVLQSGNPIPLLSQLGRLLKPGGWLQWQEWDMSTNKLLLASNPKQQRAEEAAPKLKAYVQLTRGPSSLESQTSWVSTFHTHPIFTSPSPSSAAYELIAHDRHWNSKDSLLMKQEIAFLGAREWVENLRGRGEGEEADRIERVAREAEEECWGLGRGTVIDTEMMTWVLRKRG